MDELTDAAHESRSSSARCPHVKFRDSKGSYWTAFEAPTPVVEWTEADRQSDLMGYGVGWLCFRSGDRARRLRLYRKTWHRLTGAELVRLCSRALRDPFVRD